MGTSEYDQARAADYEYERSPQHLASRIRQALTRHDQIKVDCFNLDEVDATKALLSEDELTRVSFTWNVWK